MRWLARAVDAVLEATVILSFSSIGYSVRRRISHWTVVRDDHLDGRTVLVTGATSGLGRAVAEALIRLGATVILLGRDASRTTRVADELRRATGSSSIDTVVADMGDLEEVRRAAAAVRARHQRLDVLIHNAGALVAEREFAPDGSEVTVASQLLGPFLLTGLLLDRLASAAPGRVITVSSGGMYTAPLSPAALESNVTDNSSESATFSGVKQYALVKRAQVVLTRLWASRVPSDQVVFHAMHPGWVDTPGLKESLPTFRRFIAPVLRSAAQGIDTIAWLASDDDLAIESSGRFWHDRRPRSVHRLPSTRRAETPEAAKRLWAVCVRRTGWDLTSR